MPLILIIFLCGCLTACMVGPDFHSPATPKPSTYTATPLPKKTVATRGQSGKSQHLVWGKNLESEWWTLFHSKEINALVKQGLKHSPTLAAAKATLIQAQENLNTQIGLLLFPSITGQFSAQRQRFSGQEFGDVRANTLFNLFNAGVNVNYNLDIWGGSRRQIEAYKAQVDFERFEFIAAYLTLTSNIVTTAVATASLEAQIFATNELIAATRHQLKIIKQQFELGGIPKENVLSQETLLAQTIATLPVLKKNLATARHALSALVGQLPNAGVPAIHLKNLVLPKDLPVTLPSKLVQQRPDVQASKALLHVASANIGVATANLFPQFNLSAAWGFESVVLSDLIKPVNNIWNYGTALSQSIFQGGALLAQKRAAIAAYQTAHANYRQTVLLAFKNVADVLRAIQYDAEAYKAQTKAEIAGRGSLEMAQAQFKLGAINYLALLNAQQQYQQIIINKIQAEAARYADTVALFEALGGGWWNSCA